MSDTKSSIPEFSGPYSLSKLSSLVTLWGVNRGINTGGTIAGQLLKLDEETLELDEALFPIGGNLDDERAEGANVEEAKDAIGDITVVLHMICLIKGWSFRECCEKAWEDIKDRKGVMIDGTFVKEES